MESKKNTWKNPIFLTSLPPPVVPNITLLFATVPGTQPHKNFACSLVPHT